MVRLIDYEAAVSVDRVSGGIGNQESVIRRPVNPPIQGISKLPKPAASSQPVGSWQRVAMGCPPASRTSYAGPRRPDVGGNGCSASSSIASTFRVIVARAAKDVLEMGASPACSTTGQADPARRTGALRPKSRSSSTSMRQQDPPGFSFIGAIYPNLSPFPGALRDCPQWARNASDMQPGNAVFLSTAQRPDQDYPAAARDSVLARNAIHIKRICTGPAGVGSTLGSSQREVSVPCPG